MAIGGAFLGGGVEVVPAGSCKLELEILTEDRANLTATFTIRGTSTYTVTAGADGRAVYTVPSGQTYTVSVNTTGYDNIASQTVVAESGTVRYVRFEAFEGRVKRSGDTMTGLLELDSLQFTSSYGSWRFRPSGTGYPNLSIYANNDASKPFIQMNLSSNELRLGGDNNRVISNYPIANDDNSKTVATTAWVNGASSVVHTDRDEVIQGKKTFSSPIVLNAWTGLHIKENAITKGSATQDRNINIFTGFYDKNDDGTNKTTNWLGGLRYTVPPHTTDAPPNTFVELSNQYYRDTYLRLYDNGTTTYATCPNPPSDANSNQITTAIWCNGKFVQKSGDTMTGMLKMDKGAIWLKSANAINLNTTWSWMQGLEIRDSNETRMGDFRTIRFNDGTDYGTAIDIIALNSNSAEGGLAIVKLDNGTSYGKAPNWSIGTNDNSDKILTIAMANGLPSLVHTSNNEIIQGVKSFKTPIIDPQNQSGRVSAPNSNAHVTPYYKIASLSMDNVSAWDEPTLTLDAEYGWSSNEHHVVTYRAFIKLGNNKVVENISLAKIWASGQAFATFLKEDHWFIAYNVTQNVFEIWVKVEYDQANLNYRVRMSGRRHENFANWTIHSGFSGTGVASLPSTDDGWVIVNAIDISNRMTYSTPSNAAGQEIATADWVNNKLAQKSKVTNVTSYAQLIELIKNGKRGDSFGLTMDYTGSSFGGITASGVETHAFGHYTIEELTVTDGNLASFQAFGSGEISGKFIENDNTTYTYATTGFGRAVVLQGYGDAFRVVEDGELTYFLTTETTTSFDGYYISI